MQVIQSAAVLAAIGGGDGEGDPGITCTVGTDGINCTGSLEAWEDLAFGAFDQLQDWGADFGGWLYDVTHSY